ncbi:MAG: phospholipase/carboxylesterase [Fibrobacteres bacterium]|nr:phospholipase/carboxylesterase [Fibrobacterota bacterium]
MLVVILSSLAGAQTSKFLIGGQTAKDGLRIPYRLFVPRNYDPKKAYPLVLALHGAGERGTDDSIQLTTYRLATLWAVDSNQAKYPSFILAPQCPLYPAVWVNTPFGAGTYNQDKVPLAPPLRAVVEILDSMLIKYHIDTNRVYVAGLSMGGYATWDILMRYPKRFAAAIPICGAGDTAKAALLKAIPIWAFHGDADKTVPVEGSRQMIAAIRKAGGAPVYTEYPGVDHGSWGPALQEPKLADWLFAQKRPAPTAIRSAQSPRAHPERSRTGGIIPPGGGFRMPGASVDGLGREAARVK